MSHRNYWRGQAKANARRGAGGRLVGLAPLTPPEPINYFFRARAAVDQIAWDFPELVGDFLALLRPGMTHKEIATQADSILEYGYRVRRGANQ